MVFLGLNITWWIVLIGTVVIIAVFWLAGKKTAKIFYDTLFDDMRQLMCKRAGIAPETADNAINILKSRQSATAIPPSILRIEYVLEKTNSSKVKRVLAISYVNDTGQPMLVQAERECDWDFLPDELASSIIRAKEQTINIEMYTKK